MANSALISTSLPATISARPSKSAGTSAPETLSAARRAPTRDSQTSTISLPFSTSLPEAITLPSPLRTRTVPGPVDEYDTTTVSGTEGSSSPTSGSVSKMAPTSVSPVTVKRSVKITSRFTVKAASFIAMVSNCRNQHKSSFGHRRAGFKPDSRFIGKRHGSVSRGLYGYHIPGHLRILSHENHFYGDMAVNFHTETSVGRNLRITPFIVNVLNFQPSAAVSVHESVSPSSTSEPDATKEPPSSP